MDEDNGVLYLTHGSNHIFATFNMITKRWNVMSRNKEEGKKYNITGCYSTPSVMIPKFGLHIVGSYSRHIRYNKPKKQFVSALISANRSYLCDHAMAYINNKKLLMVLGGRHPETTDSILFTKCSGDNNSNYVWNEFPLKLPHVSCPECTVVFGSVLIVYYIVHHDDDKPFMWILDCNDNEYKWVQPLLSEMEYPKDVCSIIATKTNYVHFIDPYSETHSKIHLSRLFPRNLYIKYVNEQDDDDMKCDQCDELKEKLNVMDAEKQSLHQVINDLLNNQQKIENEKKQMKEQLTQREEEVSELHKQVVKLSTELRQSQEEVGKLNEECKESKLELNEVKKELNKLKRLRRINLSNYLNWSDDDIMDWILTLEEGRYEKYEKKLRAVFNEEGVCGQAMPFIDKPELKGWGITNFMDRNNIYQHLQDLVAQNNHIKNEQELEGGNDTAYI
eukprot:427216_1